MAGLSAVGRRVLVTGLASFWGGRVAQALERRPDVDVIVGLDTSDPTIPLERTEFVRCDESYSILSRIVRATRVDTILHTFLVLDSTSVDPRTMHELNVIGTMNLFAAAGAAGSTVRDVVVKSSTLVYGSSPDDPAWFAEDTPRSHPPTTRIERSLAEVEGYVGDFALDNPSVCVTLLRFSNVLGPDISTPLSRSLQNSASPGVAGFDPLLQFTHEEDVIRSLIFAMHRMLPGTFNVAGDGALPLSEVRAILGRPAMWLPPVGTAGAAALAARLGFPKLPPEALALLRYGRGVDNRRLKAQGFRYRYTTAGTVEDWVRSARVRRTLRPTGPFRYESDVEQFFRHSPAVVRD